MDNRNKEKPKIDDFYPKISDTVSSNECTGLIPARDDGSGVLHSYKNLSNMQLQEESSNDQGSGEEPEKEKKCCGRGGCGCGKNKKDENKK